MTAPAASAGEVQDQQPEALLDPGDVARLLKVTRAAVGKWAKSGRLPAVVLGAGKRRTFYRFRPSTLAKWIADRERTLDPATRRQNNSASASGARNRSQRCPE